MIEATGQEDLSRQLRHLRSELETHFRNASWMDLARTLLAAARLGEAHGQRELCLRAQSLREVMGVRAGAGRGLSAGPRVSTLFQDLMFHLTHLEWTVHAPPAALPNRWGPSIESVGPLV